MDFSFFLLSNNSNSSISLLSSNDDAETIGSISLLSNCDEEGSCGLDGFDGKDFFGTPDLSNYEGNFIAEGSPAEAVGSVAYASTETIGSMACVGGSTSGSFDSGCSAGVSVSCSSGGSSGGGCSFVC